MHCPKCNKRMKKQLWGFCYYYVCEYCGYIILTSKEGVTMFEKEAEEYRKDLKSKFFLSEPQLDLACQGFKDGLRKANEWHNVKDGDLPKDEKDMLMSKTLILITKMKGSDCLNLALGQYNFSTQEFSYQHIVGLTDVIAWKEIVLPKESE